MEWQQLIAKYQHRRVGNLLPTMIAKHCRWATNCSPYRTAKQFFC